MQSESPYSHPYLYASQHAGQYPDLDFYVSLARQFGSRVLELGCGTGRLTIPLAREGFSVTGVDIDSKMLAAAQKSGLHEATEVQQRLSFVQQDICSMQLDCTYDIVLFPYHSIGHIAPGHQLRRLAAAVARHMSPQGACVISVLQPDEDLCRDQPGTLRHLEHFSGPSGEQVDCYETTVYTKNDRRLVFNWYYDFGDTSDLLHITNTLYLHSGEEIAAAFAGSGLHIAELFGDFDASSYSCDSPELLQLYRRSSSLNAFT